MSDQRRSNWFSGRLLTAPIADFWQVSRTVQDPSIPNLPLETPDAAPAGTFVPIGRSALVLGAIVVAAWSGPQFSALKVSTATESGAVVEQVQPPKLRDQQVDRNRAWQISWKTQTGPRIASIIPASVVTSDTVLSSKAQTHIWNSWHGTGLSALRTSTATETSDWVLPPETGDNPPVQSRNWLWNILAKHQPARFGSYSSSVYTLPVSDPPRFKNQDLSSFWPTSWKIPPTSPKYPQIVVGPVVNDPPPKVNTPSVESWRVTWQTQRRPFYNWAEVGPVVDNPPGKVLVPNVESWRVTWGAQRAPLMVWPTATTAVDDPPIRRLVAPEALNQWLPPTLTAIQVSVATETGPTPPVVGDDPPRRTQVQPAAIDAWKPKSFGSYSSSLYTYVFPPDNPPVKVNQPETIREQWDRKASWSVPKRLPVVTESGVVTGVPVTFLSGVSRIPGTLPGVSYKRPIFTPTGGGNYTITYDSGVSGNKSDSASNEEYIT
jgi:hypothetical protein